MRTWSKKLFVLIAGSIGFVSAQLLMHWVFGLSTDITLFAGWMAGISWAVGFTKTFVEDRKIGKRVRVKMGAMLWLLPLGFAFLAPSSLTVSLAVVGPLLGSTLIWWDDWQEKKLSYWKKLFRDPNAIPVEERVSTIRARVLVLKEKIEPDQDELAKLNEELHELEQKKLYRG